MKQTVQHIQFETRSLSTHNMKSLWCDAQWMSLGSANQTKFVWYQNSQHSPHKGQWRGALMFSSICAWINGWVNNGEAGDLRRIRAHYDVTVMGTELFGMVAVRKWLSDWCQGVTICYFLDERCTLDNSRHGNIIDNTACPSQYGPYASNSCILQ